MNHGYFCPSRRTNALENLCICTRMIFNQLNFGFMALKRVQSDHSNEGTCTPVSERQLVKSRLHYNCEQVATHTVAAPLYSVSELAITQG